MPSPIAGDHYDVLIVGARCAGATLATFLARAGARVLLLDKDALPSDHVLSTHGISPPGMDVLDEVGIGNAVREVTPPARTVRVNAEGVVFDLTLTNGRAEYCPRRERLDGLLQGAAVAAGVELRDRTRVTSLVQDDGRVRGVRISDARGDRTVTAGLVVGADGRHSTIAQLVQAEEYLGYDAGRAGYWAYWDAPSIWRTDSAYGFDMYFSHFSGETGIIFPTDHDQLLIGSWPSADRADAWRTSPEKTLRTVLEQEPVIGPLIRDTRPVGHVRGTIKERFFFRKAAGSGWVLVGDAGHHKDFVIGDGITEALLQARSLATAIAEGTQAALTLWWRARDVAALPWYAVGKEAGARGPLPELVRLLVARAKAHPTLQARLLEVMERRVTPFDLLPGVTLIWWTLAAALKGRPRVIRDLMATAQRSVPLYREWHQRRQLLAEGEGLPERGPEQSDSQ